MKNIFLLLLLASFYQFLLAQEDSIDIKFAPTLTTIGKPIGDKVSEPIDREGGRIISADKKMELIIPQGALSKRTDISIQPVENTLTPGSGNSYRLEPSGIIFQKPLQIIFHYSEKEDVAMPELRNIAWQDDKGQWYRLDSCVVDTSARMVTGNITHFSRWMFFDAFRLSPDFQRIKVNKRGLLFIECMGIPLPSGSIGFTDERVPKSLKFTASVNGIPGGNSIVGTSVVVKVAGPVRLFDYNAPSNVPDDNPVTFKVETNAKFTLNGKSITKLKLVAKIRVFDGAYDINVKGFNEQSVIACKVNAIDSSTCTLYLDGKRSRLENIVNMNVVVTATKCRCPVEEINKGNNIGAINIEGASKIEIIPQQPFRVIRVYFTKAAAWLPGWHAPPCGHTNDVVTPPLAIPALPFFLSWEDDGKEHLMKGGDDKNGWEIRVKPVKYGEEVN